MSTLEPPVPISAIAQVFDKCRYTFYQVLRNFSANFCGMKSWPCIFLLFWWMHISFALSPQFGHESAVGCLIPAELGWFSCGSSCSNSWSNAQITNSFCQLSTNLLLLLHFRIWEIQFTETENYFYREIQLLLPVILPPSSPFAKTPRGWCPLSNLHKEGKLDLLWKHEPFLKQTPNS